MAWFKLESTFATHPKFKKLARRLEIPEVYVRGHVSTFWAWVLVHAPDGNLSSFDREDIAVAAEWPGDPEHFVESMVAVKLLDDLDGVLMVHEWMDRAGSYREAMRKAAKRLEGKKKDPDSPQRVRNVSADSPEVSRNVPGERRGEERRGERGDQPPLGVVDVQKPPFSKPPNPSTWSPGDPVSSVQDFQRAFEEVWSLGLVGSKATTVCRQLCEADPITPAEIEEGRRAIEGRNLFDPASYMLGAIVKIRERNAKVDVRGLKAAKPTLSVKEQARQRMDEIWRQARAENAAAEQEAKNAAGS